jgi:PAS domain S-box-containing protein
MEHNQFFSKHCNILIIESQSYNLTMLNIQLRKKDYDVKYMKYYDLTLDLVIESSPDIILLDCKELDSEGYKLCKNIKANDKLMNIPVIFIIPNLLSDQREKLYTAGGDDYLVLPFNYTEVFSRIDTQLKIRYLQSGNTYFQNINQKEYENIEYLIKENQYLKKSLEERTQMLDEITMDLKDFNIMLEEEITERTKTEKALKESERQFRYAIEEAPVPMMLYAEDGEILKLSRTWRELTGYTHSEIPTLLHLIEKVTAIVKNSDYKDDITLLNFQAIENDKECTIMTKNGDIRVWHLFSSYIGRLQDNRKLFSIVSIDITEKKRIEELQNSVDEERKRLAEIKEYDRIKTEFFSNISHELRTPINVIFSALQIFELKFKDCICEKLSSDRYKYTKIMRQNCYRLLRLVNNLIDITKIDSGYYEITKRNIDIINLIENITLSVADYIETKGISLIFDTNIEEKTIACDAEKFERIILNLLSNAVKFTPNGGQILVNIEDLNDSISIRIKDTGRGIPKNKLNSIFERFVQVDKSLARDHEGSGIGLSLVKCLVELHGGTISVKSKEGHGTEFNINIPYMLIDKVQDEIAYPKWPGDSYIEKITIEFSDIYS